MKRGLYLRSLSVGFINFDLGLTLKNKSLSCYNSYSSIETKSEISKFIPLTICVIKKPMNKDVFNKRHKFYIFNGFTDYFLFRTVINTSQTKEEAANSEAESLRIEGNEYFEVGNYIRAEEVYTAAILINNQDFRLFNNRAQAKISMKKVTI